MGKHFKRLILIMFGTAIFFIVSTANSYAYIMANYSESAYGEAGEKSANVSLNAYIVDGAGYFLRGYSEMLLFLDRVEISDVSGVDYHEIGNILGNAIENMEKAKDAYTNLKHLADSTPYNPVIISQLLSFDYSGFQEVKGLNPSIFKKVEGYLKKGDVRGVYGFLLSGTGAVLEKLYLLKETVDSGKFPEVSDLWRVNQAFSETMFFGQYTAEVFATLLNAY